MTLDQNTKEFSKVLMEDIYFWSSPRGMTERLAESLPFQALKVPANYREKTSQPMAAGKNFVLIVPTYKSEADKNAVPRCLKEFLNTLDNAKMMKGVIGVGNITFGDDFCRAADVIASRFGVPVLGRIELAGTPEDVEMLTEKIHHVMRDSHLEDSQDTVGLHKST